MYEFIDTIEHRSVVIRPAEAMKINGIYIEDKIPGYRTLHVSGRELLEEEIDSAQIGKTDGEQYRGKRHTPRVITVTYKLAAKSNIEFRNAYNALNELLGTEESKLEFDDEPDKYFIGTKGSNNEVTAGMNHVVGEIEFYCSDPKKYSSVETTFPAEINSSGNLECTIVNNGTEAVPVTYNIKHNHENGFIGIVSEYGALQFGYVDEVDSEVRQKSETLLNYRRGSDFSAMQDGAGIVTEPGKIPINGSFKVENIAGINCLTLNNVGSGNYWHGAAKQIELPEGSDGKKGAVNFKVQSRVWFETGKVNQMGLLELVIGDESGKLLCDIHLVKGSSLNNIAKCNMKIQGMGDAQNDVKKIEYEPNYQSPTNVDGGVIYIQKQGELFTFCFAGKTYSFRAPALKNKRALTVTVFLGQYANKGAGNLVTRMYFRDLTFRSDSVEYVYDIPNRYWKGSEVRVDGEAGKTYVDGIPSGDEIVGSKYFKVPPGETRVEFLFSDFCVPLPTVEARIREAYI